MIQNLHGMNYATCCRVADQDLVAGVFEEIRHAEEFMHMVHDQHGVAADVRELFNLSENDRRFFVNQTPYVVVSPSDFFAIASFASQANALVFQRKYPGYQVVNWLDSQ